MHERAMADIDQASAQITPFCRHDRRDCQAPVGAPNGGSSRD